MFEMLSSETILRPPLFVNVHENKQLALLLVRALLSFKRSRATPQWNALAVASGSSQSAKPGSISSL